MAELFDPGLLSVVQGVLESTNAFYLLKFDKGPPTGFKEPVPLRGLFRAGMQQDSPKYLVETPVSGYMIVAGATLSDAGVEVIPDEDRIQFKGVDYAITSCNPKSVIYVNGENVPVLWQIGLLALDVKMGVNGR